MDEGNRFRRTLKNPFVMIGLCLIAGIAIYSNVIEPAMNSSVTPSISFNPSSPVTNSIAEITSHRAYEDEATQWIDNPDRDPFAPVSVAKWSNPSSKQATTLIPTTQVETGRLASRFTLKAVAIEARQRSAVINRSVVYEGEMIEGYQVVTIQLEGIWLKRHGKKHFLTFATNTTS